MTFVRKFLGHSLILRPPAKSSLSQREQLLAIITHANRTTPYYKGKFDLFLSTAHNLSDEEFFYAFGHLPIATKQDLRARNTDFVSENLKDKPDLLAGGKAPTALEFINRVLFKKDFCTSISTGGSSGIPTFRWLDHYDANIFAQSFLHSFKLNGWTPGENFVVFYPLKSYFTGTYAAKEKALHNLFGFTMVPFEDINRETIENLLETLRKRKATLLVIFPCVLQRIAEIMAAEKIAPFENLPCINVSGEFLLDCSKRFIQTMFPDSDIQSTYGAVEFGEIAHQYGLSSQDYKVFDDYVYMEQGPDNTMLVTALRQKAFPLIRYQIEDMGRIATAADGTQTITMLEGKNTDYVIGADGYCYYASFFNALINEINKSCGFPIIHFMLRIQTSGRKNILQINFVLSDHTKAEYVETASLEVLQRYFANFDGIEALFLPYFEHDYTRKFKIIGEGDGLAEVVGGYYQHQALAS